MLLSSSTKISSLFTPTLRWLHVGQQRIRGLIIRAEELCQVEIGSEAQVLHELWVLAHRLDRVEHRQLLENVASALTFHL